MSVLELSKVATVSYILNSHYIHNPKASRTVCKWVHMVKSPCVPIGYNLARVMNVNGGRLYKNIRWIRFLPVASLASEGQSQVA